MTMPGAYTSVSIALGVIRARKPPPLQHVLRQGGSLLGGPDCFIVRGKKRAVMLVHLL